MRDGGMDSIRDSSSTAIDLCMAAYQMDTRLVTDLLDAGADPNALAKSSTVHGYTALTAACGFAANPSDIIDILLRRGACIDMPNHYGRTPLISAVINGNAATCDHLCERGAALELRHKNGMTAIDYARKAVTESRSTEDRTHSHVVLQTLLRRRACRRWSLVARHVLAHHIIASHWRALLLVIYDEVHFRPGGLGEIACSENFEATGRLLEEVTIA